jgi:REP element-mobilizing transposase RayT
MNRGVAHRPMFESDRDVRRFEERLAKLAERGSIELDAYAVLQTHYHLLLVSLDGCVSRSLHFLQAPYASWYNWSRERDGPLLRGRFLAKRVDSTAYRHRLVRYIDANPVRAGLVRNPARYPHCSARHYARHGGPTWLCRRWVEREVVETLRIERYDPGRYFEVFPPSLDEAELRMIEADLASGVDHEQGIDLLLQLGTGEMREWMEDRIALADGVRRLRPLVDADVIVAAVRASHPEPAARRGNPGRRSRTAGHAIALLLRTLGGLRIGEIAAQIGCTNATASRLWREASTRAAEDREFAAVVAALAQQIVQSFWTR